MIEQTTDHQQADIGVTGLAVMGRNLARNIASRGYTVAVHNRTPARAHDLVTSHGHEAGFVVAEQLTDLVAALSRPRRIVVMVKAGAPTDATIDVLASLLDPGDVVVDAGNAHYLDTERRQAVLAARGIHLLGTGVSGGEEGALRGPSIMPGGAPEAYELMAPVLDAIAARVDGEPCSAYVGPGGAGHFVKMVHNGIEYVDMQLIAEAYDVLRSQLGRSPAELADVFDDWNDGELDSFLIEITARVLRVLDASGQPFVDVLRDEAEQKGTGRWSVEAALTLGVPSTAMAEAVAARATSGSVHLRAGVRESMGPARTPDSAGTRLTDLADPIEAVRRALLAAKVVAYAQGLDLIRAASDANGWDVDLAAVTSLWRGGCIIRARLLHDIRSAFARDPRLSTLLADPSLAARVVDYEPAWRSVISSAVLAGVPVPALAATLASLDSLRAVRLPAALIQGQRDLFGAHTYRRTDRDGTFHRDWSGDAVEVQVSG